MTLNDFVHVYEKAKTREDRIASFIEDVDDEYQENVYKRKENIDIEKFIVGTDDTIIEGPDDQCPVCFENIDNEWYLCLDCGQILCKTCFEECVLRTQRCPVCNENEWNVLKCLLTSKND